MNRPLPLYVFSEQGDPEEEELHGLGWIASLLWGSICAPAGKDNLLLWTSHENTTDFVDLGLVAGGDVRATQLAGTPTVPSPLVTDL